MGDPTRSRRIDCFKCIYNSWVSGGWKEVLNRLTLPAGGVQAKEAKADDGVEFRARQLHTDP